MIRKAQLKDAEEIHKLVSYYAKKNALLPRELSNICESIRDFWVCEEGGRVTGCVALYIYSDEIAEVRSLAVDCDNRGKGTGGELLTACAREAKRLGIKKIFALTLAPEFFKKHGFENIDKVKLPQKIWSDCVVCSKFTKCDEVAYIKRL